MSGLRINDYCLQKEHISLLWASTFKIVAWNANDQDEWVNIEHCSEDSWTNDVAQDLIDKGLADVSIFQHKIEGQLLIIKPTIAGLRRYPEADMYLHAD